MISILPSNASQIASSLFSKLDTKSQGFIEKSDLQAAFSKLDSSSSSSDTSSVDEIFSSLDSDQDGKITKSEMTTGIENLVGQLNSQLNSSRVQNGMPPPPPPKGDDQGFTKDELSSIASKTDDSNLASLMSSIAANFDAADTNGDGKVNSEEAMAYKQASESGSSTASTDTSNPMGGANPMNGPGGMPPPPPPSQTASSDEGYTKDELSSIASETTDTKLADLMTKLASNFEAADTNQDGKVSAQEAQAYEQQSQTSTSSASSSNNEANVLMKIAQLLQAYSSSSSDASSSISVTA